MERVIYRLNPCGCGCNGRDPWHRQTYRRQLTMLSADTATCRLPMSSQPVIVRREYGLWIVDRDSIVFDK
jgi:hypothetical protein